MAEDTAPVTPTEPAAPSLPSDADRRAAAIAALGPEDVHEGTPEAPAAKAEPVKTDEEKKAAELVSPQLAAIHRAKKRASDELEGQKRAFNETVTKERAELDAVKPELDALRAFKANPGDSAALAKAAGLTPEQRVAIATDWLYGEMGGEAPKDWQAKKELLEIRRQAEAAAESAKEAVKSQAEALAREREEFAMQQEMAGARTFLREYISKLDDKRPHLKVRAMSDPEALAEDILATFNGERERIAKERGIPVAKLAKTIGPTAEQIADHFERELAAALSPYRAAWQPTTTTKPADKTQPARTLTNKASSPTAPRPAALTDKERRANAIAAMERAEREQS